MSTEGQQKARQYHPLTGMETLLGEEKPSLAALREGFAKGWDAAAEHYAARDAEVAAKAWDEGAEEAWGRSTPEVNGMHYRWRSSGEPYNPYRIEQNSEGNET